MHGKRLYGTLAEFVTDACTILIGIGSDDRGFNDRIHDIVISSISLPEVFEPCSFLSLVVLEASFSMRQKCVSMDVITITPRIRIVKLSVRMVFMHEPALVSPSQAESENALARKARKITEICWESREWERCEMDPCLGTHLLCDGTAE